MNVDEIRKRHDTAETCIEFPEDTIGYFAHKDRGFLLAEVERLRKELLAVSTSGAQSEEAAHAAESNLSRLLWELEKTPRFKRFVDSDGNKTGHMVPDDDGEWCRWPLIRRILAPYRPTADEPCKSNTGVTDCNES